VLFEPGETKDHALLAELGDCEEDAFRMSFVGHDYVYNSVYAPGLIQSPIYVVDWDQLRQLTGWKFSVFDKVSVNEVSSSSGVYHMESRSTMLPKSLPNSLYKVTS